MVGHDRKTSIADGLFEIFSRSWAFKIYGMNMHGHFLPWPILNDQTNNLLSMEKITAALQTEKPVKPMHSWADH
jgi:hypothetical protein